MAQDPAEYYRGLSAGYTDAIQRSDIKANIVLFFLSIMMGPVLLGPHDKYPAFLTLPVLFSPFLAVFFCLFVVLKPRHSPRGRTNFLVSRTAKPHDFQFVEDAEAELSELRLRCAILSDILYWKTLWLRIAFLVTMTSIVIGALMILYYGVIVKI